MYIFIRIHKYKHAYIYIYLHINICIHICIHIYSYIHTYTFIYIYIYTQTYTVVRQQETLESLLYNSTYVESKEHILFLEIFTTLKKFFFVKSSLSIANVKSRAALF